MADFFFFNKTIFIQLGIKLLFIFKNKKKTKPFILYIHRRYYEQTTKKKRSIQMFSFIKKIIHPPIFFFFQYNIFSFIYYKT